MTGIVGGHVNAVLRCVGAMSKEGDTQLTILALSLAVACKSCKVEKAAALAVFGGLFDQEIELVPLDALKSPENN